MGGNVAGGGDVAAEDDGAEPVLQELPDVGYEGGEFGVAFGPGEAVGGGNQAFEFAGFLVHGGSGFEVALAEFGIVAVVEAVVVVIGGLGICGGIARWRAGEAGFEGLRGGSGRG